MTQRPFSPVEAIRRAQTDPLPFDRGFRTAVSIYARRTLLISLAAASVVGLTVIYALLRITYVRYVRDTSALTHVRDTSALTLSLLLGSFATWLTLMMLRQESALGSRRQRSALRSRPKVRLDDFVGSGPFYIEALKFKPHILGEDRFLQLDHKLGFNSKWPPGIWLEPRLVEDWRQIYDGYRTAHDDILVMVLIAHRPLLKGTRTLLGRRKTIAVYDRRVVLPFSTTKALEADLRHAVEGTFYVLDGLVGRLANANELLYHAWLVWAPSGSGLFRRRYRSRAEARRQAARAAPLQWWRPRGPRRRPRA